MDIDLNLQNARFHPNLLETILMHATSLLDATCTLNSIKMISQITHERSLLLSCFAEGKLKNEQELQLLSCIALRTPLHHGKILKLLLRLNGSQSTPNIEPTKTSTPSKEEKTKHFPSLNISPNFRTSLIDPGSPMNESRYQSSIMGSTLNLRDSDLSRKCLLLSHKQRRTPKTLKL